MTRVVLFVIICILSLGHGCCQSAKLNRRDRGPRVGRELAIELGMGGDEGIFLAFGLPEISKKYEIIEV